MATYTPDTIARLLAEAQRIEDPEARAIALFRIEFETNPSFRGAVLAHITSTVGAPRVPLPLLHNAAPIVRVVRVLDGAPTGRSKLAVSRCGHCPSCTPTSTTPITSAMTSPICCCMPASRS